jgi:2-methylcitrate dehydratase PrpD
MNLTESVSEYVVKLRYEDLPSGVVDRIKIQLLDSMGVMSAGVEGKSIAGVVNFLRDCGGKEEAAVVLQDLRIPAHLAAFCNSLMMRSFDFGMITAEGPDHIESPNHASETNVPASLAAGEAMAVSGKELMTALAIGNDISSRLTCATKAASRWGGKFGNTGTLSGISSACIASRLFGLTVRQTCDAMGLALPAIGGTNDDVNDNATSFKLPVALASRTGVFSAQLAKTGFIAVKDALGGDAGYFGLFGGGADEPETILEGLGTVFYADCELKPWPGCRGTHKSVTCVANLMAESPINSAQIVKVIIRQPSNVKLVGKKLDSGGDQTTNALFNVRFAVACMLAKGDLSPRYECDEFYDDPDIRRLHDSTDIIYSDDPITSVEVVFEDGASRKASVQYARGDVFFDPLPREDILNKFWKNVEFSKRWERGKAQAMIDMIDDLENVEDMRKLMALVGPSR